LLVGVIYDRRHTRDIDEFGGLAKGMPWFATAFVIITMSSIGLPGTNGFIGEFMVLSGSYVSDVFRYPAVVTALAATGVILGAIYMLHVVLKLFWGPLSNPKNLGLPDLSRREVLTIVPLIVLVFWIGFFPRSLLVPMERAVEQFATAYDEKLRISYATHETRLLPPAQNLDGSGEGEGDSHEGHDHEEGAAPAGEGAQARVVVPGGGAQ
jgi:NADH-quinone oxidoreductase subunit M